MFSITGEHDHSPFGSQGVQLVWGQRPDASLAHISEVARGQKCDCVCPACELGLIAKKGPRLAEHFAHRGGKACAGVRETNAHAWAKKILEARNEIYLPPVIGSAAGKRLQTHAGRLYKFESARLEKRAGSIIPDVVLVDANRRELIVEILVTHACDEAKIGKIREQGTPALEVDLSRLRRAESEGMVAEALIGASPIGRAPRRWLHNPKIERAAEQLAEKLKREAAEREEACDRQARSIILAAAAVRLVSTDATLADMGTVDAFDRTDLIGIAVPGARGFCVLTRLWQAAVLARVIFPAAEEWGAFVDARMVREAIMDCIAPAFRTEPAGELGNAVHRAEPSFLFPSAAIAHYLVTLADRRVLERESYDVFRLDPDEAEYLRRRAAKLGAQRNRDDTARQRLRAICDRIPADDRGSFSLDRWLAQPIQDFGARFADLVKSEDGRWKVFDIALGEIERMFRDGTPASATLGMPIGPEIERAVERERIAKETARRARVERLTARAVQALGPDRAQDWLASTPESGAASCVELARESTEGLEQAQGALAAAERELVERQRREREAEGYRAQLRSEAIKVHGLERAEVFLLSTDLRIGMSPWDKCTDAVGLKACLALLSAKARGIVGRRGRR